MTIDHAAALSRLRAALTTVGDALANADLETLLNAEPELGAALEAVARLPIRAAADVPVLEIDDARAALLRCRRLGTALVEFTRISLDPTGGPGYSRTGAAPGGERTRTIEARG